MFRSAYQRRSKQSSIWRCIDRVERRRQQIASGRNPLSSGVFIPLQVVPFGDLLYEWRYCESARFTIQSQQHPTCTTISFFSTVRDNQIKDEKNGSPYSLNDEQHETRNGRGTVGIDKELSISKSNQMDRFIHNLVNDIRRNVQVTLSSLDEATDSAEEAVNAGLPSNVNVDGGQDVSPKNAHTQGLHKRQKSWEQLWEEAIARVEAELYPSPKQSKDEIRDSALNEDLRNLRNTIEELISSFDDNRGGNQNYPAWANSGVTVDLQNKEGDAGKMDGTVANSLVVDSATNESMAIREVNSIKDNFEDCIKAIAQSIALLSIMTSKEWALADAIGRQAMKGQVEEEIEMFDTKNDFMLIDEEDRRNMPESTRGEGNSDVIDLLEEVNNRKFVLNTLESNLLLSRLLTETVHNANGSSTDFLMQAVLQIYEEMDRLGDSGRDDCAPDATTYRLLLLALNRRFRALSEAKRLFCNMLHASPNVNYSSNTFLIGMQACFQSGDLALARDSMHLVLHGVNDGKGPLASFRPCAGVYLNFLDMLRKEHSWQEALELMDEALKPSSRLKSSDIDKLLVSLCRWKLKPRRGDRMGPSPFLVEILHRMERREANHATSAFRVWASLIDGLARLASADESMWKEVQRAFNLLWIAHPDCNPGEKLLRHGLAASEATSDGRLASEIIFREVNKCAPSPFEAAFTTNSSLPEALTNDNSASVEEALGSMTLQQESTALQNESWTRSAATPLPHTIFRKGLEICLTSRDMDSATLILRSFEKVSKHYPQAKQSEFYGLALMNHARGGDAEAAKSLLDTMETRGMNPSEELYASVLQCFATAGMFEEVREMFESMKADKGNHGKELGVSSYNALLNAHVRSRSWEDALLLYETMKQSGVTLNASTAQGVLLASYGFGGKPQVQSCLEELLNGNGNMDRATFHLASKILLQGANDWSATVLGERLRDVADTEPHLRSVALDLLHSIRIAEADQTRQPEAKIPAGQVKQIGDDSWRSAMKHLLKFVQTHGKSSDRE